MQRRKFLSAVGSGSLLGAATPWYARAAANSSPDDWQAKFAQSLADQPWLLGYTSASQPMYQGEAKLEGKWPAELQGTLYRNGPARHEIGNYRYHHWFDGDGMMQAYRITEKGVSHQSRFIDTYKYQAEKAAGRALYPGFASVPPDPAPVTSPDTVNPGNISVLHHHGKLLALWEAGSAWQINPDDLSTEGTYAFSDNTRGVPFSAHPRVEADGTLWNFGYLSAANIFVLWHIDKNGKLVKIGKVAADPITMVHDFIVTSRHIVLLVPPLNYEQGSNNFLDAHKWYPDQPTRVLVVDKNDFDNHYWVELPAQWVFHFGNGWEDEQGVIRFDAARADNPLVMIDTFRDIMRGKFSGAPTSHHHQYRLDTRTRSITEVPLFGLNFDSEFPCIDPRISCRRNDRLFMLSHDQRYPTPHGNLNEISSFNFASGHKQTFRYPDNLIPEEHLFVPRADSAPETDGWVVGTALDWRAQKTLLNVFAANHLDAGPLATATLPYFLPLGLHGKFVRG